VVAQAADHEARAAWPLRIRRQGDPGVGAANPPGAFQVIEHVAQPVVVDAKGITQLSTGDWMSSAADGVQDPLLKGQGGGDLGRIARTTGCAGRGGNLQVRSSAVMAGHQTQLERVGGWGGAMFEREPESFPFGARADEIGGMIGPGMEIAGASKGLSEMGTDGFAHVVDEDDGHVVPSLQLAQVAQQG